MSPPAATAKASAALLLLPLISSLASSSRLPSLPPSLQDERSGGVGASLDLAWIRVQLGLPKRMLCYLSLTEQSFQSSSSTGFSSEIGTKLRDWAVGQAGAGCYSLAALSSNDSKTLYGP